MAWSITGLVLSLPLCLIAWQLFKHRKRLIDGCKAWLASRSNSTSGLRAHQRQLDELSACVGPSWAHRVLVSSDLQSAICLGRSPGPLRLLMQDSSCGFARRCGMFEQQTADPTQSFGWARHDNFFLLGWAQKDFDDSLEAWSKLLSLAARTWPFRKAKYLLLSIEAQELLVKDPIELQEKAQFWGQQLHLTNLALGRQLPIYLVIQGMESLPGFETFVAHTPPDLRSTPWGWICPAAGGVETQHQELEDIHHRFTQALMTRVLVDSLAKQAGPDSKDLVNFSQAFSSLELPLRDTLRTLLSYRFSNDPVALRGVYFSGSDQGQGVFRGRLFDELCNASQTRAPLIPQVQRRVQLQTRGAIAGLGLAALVSLALPWNAANHNQQLQSQMQGVLGELKTTPNKDPNLRIWSKSFELDQRVAAVRNASPWNYGLGMSQAQLLEHGSRSLFISLTTRWGVQPMLMRDLKRIQTLSQSPEKLNSEQARELQHRLFRYLLLSKADQEPPVKLSKTLSHRLTQSLAGHWSKFHVFASGISAKAIAQRFVFHLAQSPSFRLPQDARLVDRAREKLIQSDLLVSFAHETIQSYNQDHPPLNIEGALIPAAFTRKGWNQALRPRFQNYLHQYLQEVWVFGFDPKKTAHLQNNAGLWLASTYANAFEEAWKRKLQDLPHRFPSSERTPDNLETIYADFFEEISTQVKTHTQLTALAKQGKDSIAELSTKFSALHQFAQPNQPSGTALPQYLSILRKLSKLEQETDPSSSKLAAVDALLLETEAISSAQPKAWRSFFAKALSSPLKQYKHSARSQRKQIQSTTWCELSRRLHAELFDRYPFKKHASQEVELGPLAALLHPKQGELWRFVESEFGEGIELREGEIRTIDRSFQSKLHPRLIKQLNAAWRVSQALFSQDRPEPRISMLVRPRATRNISMLRLRIHDQDHSLSTREPVTVLWPSPSISSLAHLFLKHAETTLKVHERGTWALFRLLESGHQHRKETANTFFVSWQVGERDPGQAQLQVRVEGAASPFFSYPRRSFLALFRSRWLQRRPPLFVQQHKCHS